MKERATRYYKIIGYKNDLDNLEHFLRHAEYLGKVGASRNLLLRIDGDGSGRINIYKVGPDYKTDLNVKIIDNKSYNIKQNNQQTFKSDIVGIYDIGE